MFLALYAFNLNSKIPCSCWHLKDFSNQTSSIAHWLHCQGEIEWERERERSDRVRLFCMWPKLQTKSLRVFRIHRPLVWLPFVPIPASFTLALSLFLYAFSLFLLLCFFHVFPAQHDCCAISRLFADRRPTDRKQNVEPHTIAARGRYVVERV